MDREMNSVRAKEVYKTVSRSSARGQVLSIKWVFAVRAHKFKARIVVRGFEQPWQERGPTFSPTLNFDAFRVVASTANAMDLDLKHMDVETAFLYSPLHEPVWCEFPDGYRVDGCVMELQRALYGLPGAPRAWHVHIDSYLCELGFLPVRSETCLYYHKSRRILLARYVDDMVVASMSESYAWLREQLNERFVVEDLGDVSTFLGVSVARDRQSGLLTLHLSKYMDAVLAKFNMTDCTPADCPLPVGPDFTVRSDAYSERDLAQVDGFPYRSVVGHLQYAASTCRPDLSYACSVLSRVLVAPTPVHVHACNHVLRYIKGTRELGITFSGGEWDTLDVDGMCMAVFHLDGYADASLTDQPGAKSTDGHVVFMGGGPVIWRSRVQRTAAQGTCESEYDAMAQCTKALIYVKSVLEEWVGLFISSGRLSLHGDNTAALDVSSDEGTKKRTKHFERNLHYVRDYVVAGEIVLRYVPSKENVADIFTKVLDRRSFLLLRAAIMGA